MVPGVIVRPDVAHSYNANGAIGAMVFVDPESAEGVWLKTSLREDITIVPEARTATCAAELRTFLDRPLEGLPIGALVRHCVQTLCAGAPPSRRLNERVTRVLTAIRQSDDLRVSIEEAAADHPLANQTRSMVMNNRTFDRTSLRLSATLLLLGQLLYFVITLFHTGGEANDHHAIFAAYAASNLWTAVHVAQFACTALLLAGLFALSFALDVQAGTGCRAGWPAPKATRQRTHSPSCWLKSLNLAWLIRVHPQIFENRS